MKIRNVLLVFPHRRIPKGYSDDLAPPLGLAYIGAALEAQGYAVAILDVVAEGFGNRVALADGSSRVGLDFPEVRRRMAEFKPDIVGVSVLFSSQMEDAHAICEMGKSPGIDAVTVVGGPHVSALPEDTLARGSIDYVVIGEGERSSVELLGALVSGRGLSAIDGLAYMADGVPKVNPKTSYIEDLDSLPMPARHLLPMEKYFKVNLPQSGTSARTPNTTIMSSRGCTARCVFCATSRFWGHKFRMRSVEKVLDELEHLVSRYGVREVQFIDDNLTLDKDRAIRLFQGMIDRKLDLAWCTPQGIALWSLDERVLQKMRESGCYEITMAIESGDQSVLRDIIRKPLDLGKIRPLVQKSKELGMLTKGYFVVGFPGETLPQMKATVDFARSLRLDASSIFIATPLPGTELYRICREGGYLREGFSFDKLIYARCNIATPDFRPQEVERLVSRAILRLNLEPMLWNPARFLRKYSLLLRRNPSVLLKHVLFLARRSR